MDIKIIYDNEAQPPLKSDWGFSALIRAYENVLFDTGDSGEILKHNMEKMGIATSEIDKIVLSHDHHDHTGGLFSVLEKDMNVYVHSKFSSSIRKKISQKARLMEIKGKEKICDNVITTGELGDGIVEQSVMIKYENGYILMTGCAHPGLTHIIKKSEKIGKIKGVIGGFHAFDNFDVLKDVSFVVPCHCTQHKDKIKKMYPDKMIDCYAGLEFKIGGDQIGYSNSQR